LEAMMRWRRFVVILLLALVEYVSLVGFSVTKPPLQVVLFIVAALAAIAILVLLIPLILRLSRR
jgi:hypothetical protein